MYKHASESGGVVLVLHYAKKYHVSFIEEIFLTLELRHSIIQHNKFCPNKYFRIANQVQKEETT